MEELRYEQERLRWQLNQATHLGTSSLQSMQAAVDPTSAASASNYCSDSSSDRYIMAKHAVIYPTTEDVSCTVKWQYYWALCAEFCYFISLAGRAYGL